MNNKILLALFLGAIVGCVANEAVRAGTVTAQATNGQFRECVAYTLDYDGDLEDLGANAKPIAGWTPVGGTVVSERSQEAVVLCR